jgi:hypothetical protein
MSEMITIRQVEALEGHEIRAEFSDGAVKEIDLGDLIGKARGVFRGPGDPNVFTQVRVNPQSGTLEWPGEVDPDSEVRYRRCEPASGMLRSDGRFARPRPRSPATATGGARPPADALSPARARS